MPIFEPTDDEILIPEKSEKDKKYNAFDDLRVAVGLSKEKDTDGIVVPTDLERAEAIRKLRLKGIDLRVVGLEVKVDKDSKRVSIVEDADKVEKIVELKKEISSVREALVNKESLPPDNQVLNELNVDVRRFIPLKKEEAPSSFDFDKDSKNILWEGQLEAKDIGRDVYLESLSSNDSGSSMERALAYDVVARVLTAPEGSVLKLIVRQRDKEGKLILKEGKPTYKEQDIKLDLEAFADDEHGEVFNALSRHFWQGLATHGTERTTATGKIFKKYSDADGELAVELMKAAGIDTKNVTFVNKGEFAEGKVSVDTGGKRGGISVVVEPYMDQGIEKWRVTTIVDHHPEGEESASKMVYKSLIGLGLLEKTKGASEAVAFLNAIDNGKIPGNIPKDKMFDFFKNQYASTLYGIEGFLKGSGILKFFRSKNHHDPLIPLDIGQKEDIDLKDSYGKEDKVTKVDKIIARIQENVDNSIEAIRRLEAQGSVLKSDKYGKILVDIGGKVPLTGKAARMLGYDGYLSWKPEEKFFLLVTDLDNDIELNDGIKVRNLLMKRGGEDLKIGLVDIVGELIKEGGSVEKGLDDYLHNIPLPDVLTEEERASIKNEEDTEKESLKWYKGIENDLMRVSFLRKHLIKEEKEKYVEALNRLKDNNPKFPEISEIADTEGSLNRQKLRAAWEYLTRPEVSGDAKYFWKTKEEAMTFLSSIGIASGPVESGIVEPVQEPTPVGGATTAEPVTATEPVIETPKSVKLEFLNVLEGRMDVVDLNKIKELMPKLSEQHRKMFEFILVLLKDEVKRSKETEFWNKTAVPILTDLGVQMV